MIIQINEKFSASLIKLAEEHNRTVEDMIGLLIATYYGVHE